MRKPARLDARSAIRRAVAEVLEPRRLFAAIESGMLVARGTANADTISLRRTGTDDVIVTTNGANQTFDFDDFNAVRLEGLGGNDRLTVLERLLNRPVTLDGGAGNDTLATSTGSETIIGGAGTDTADYSARTENHVFSTFPSNKPLSDRPNFYLETPGIEVDNFANGDIEAYVGGSGEDNFFFGGSFTGTPPLTHITFNGGGGNDSFNQDSAFGPSFDVVGGDGNDGVTLIPGSNPTSLNGGAGDDVFGFIGIAPHAGFVSGSTGIDRIDLGPTAGLATLDLRQFPDIENAFITGDDAITTQLIGNGLNNDLRAQNSNHAVTLQGLGGNDTLTGSNFNDLLDGGDGADTLQGGPGNDTYVNGETIIDPDPGQGDPTTPAIAIRSDGVLSASGSGGNDTFTIRRVGTDNLTITVNALSREFDMDDFSGISLQGFGGNDRFNLTQALTTPVVRNVTVLGGLGDDAVDYSARTAAITFRGYIEPDSNTLLPFITATQGAAVDRIASDVETIVGGSGSDAFDVEDSGGIGDDGEFTLPDLTLDGRGGNDHFGPAVGLTIFQLGGAGNDSFSVDESAGEVISAGDGDDRVSLNGESLTSFDGGAGLDTMSVGGSLRSNIDMNAYPGLENLEGAGDHVTLVIGNALNNRISAEFSTDGDITLRGMGGNDTLVGGETDDQLEGGEGNDSLIGNAGNDTLDGGNGTDFADGDGGNNTHISIEQFAGGGSASIAIVSRVLTATGTGGNDTITIQRSLSDDVIVKVGSLSRTFDMDDFDTVLLQGLGGNDTITILDPIVAGSLVRKVTLDGGAGNDSLTGNSGDDVIRGGDGLDTLVGLGGRDAISGNAGNDQLFGGTGLDFLDAGDNDDFIDSSDSAGGDTVLGGNGTADSARVDAGDETSGVESFV
jgi:Ca2+-binding RTX toxin-like protein